MFMHCIELSHASHILIFGKHTQASKLGGGLSIYPIVARVRHRGEYSTSSNVSIWQIWGDKKFLSFIGGKKGMGVAT